MQSSPPIVYLVTGANRGIGLALVARIAQTHLTAFIYAGVRDPSKAAGLDELAALYPGRIAVLKCISGDTESNARLAKEIEARHGRVDTVIANAGIANTADTVLNTAPSDLQEHFSINVIGPVVLFQALHGLLKASASPRFVPISTGAACISGPVLSLGIGTAAYGGSKIALNYVTRKIHFENEWLIAFPLAPGAVVTDMLNHNLSLDHSGVYAKLLEGYTPQTPEQCAAALLGIIDGAAREKDGGEFLNVDGSRLPW